MMGERNPSNETLGPKRDRSPRPERGRLPECGSRAFPLRILAWSALLYGLVSAVLATLTYDAFNLNSDIYTSSFLALGLNPYVSGTSFPPNILVGAGYFILPYNYLAFATYSYFSSNLLVAALSLKALGIAAGFAAALLVLKISGREGLQPSKTMFYAMLFNPYLIFVTAVWGGSEIFIVVLLLLAIFLLRYRLGSSSHYPALLLAGVAVAATVFGYYLTIMLVPTLILFRRTRRQQLEVLGMLAILGLLFGAPIVLFGLISPGTVAAPVNGAGMTIFSFLNLLPPTLGVQAQSIPRVFLGLIVLLAVAIPFLFRRVGVNEGTTLVAVFFVSFGLTFYLNADVLAIAAGLVPLALALQSKLRLTYLRTLAFQLFLFPITLVVQMYDGTSQASGIYYWSYYWLRQNVVLYGALGGKPATVLYLALFYLGAIASVAALVWVDLHRPDRPRPSSGFSPRPEELSRPSGLRRRDVAVLLVAVILIVSVPTSIAVEVGAQPALDMRNQFNAQDFYPTDLSSPGNYPLPGPGTFTIEPSSGKLAFSSSSPAIGFVRNVTGQNIRLAFTASVPPIGGGLSETLLKSNQSVIEFSNLLVLPQGTVPWSPTMSQGAIPRNSSVPAIAGNETVYSLNGSAVIGYSASFPQLANRTQYFGAQTYALSAGQTFLWALYSGNGLAECFLTSQDLFLGVKSGTSWHFVAAPLPVNPGQWFLDGFGFGPGDATVFTVLNGQYLALAFPSPQVGGVTVFVGAPDALTSRNPTTGWVGNVTGIYSIPNTETQFLPAFATLVGSPFSPWHVSPGLLANLTYMTSVAGVTVSIDGSSFTTSGTDHTLLVGKLSLTPLPVSFAFQEVFLGRSTQGPDLALVVLDFTIILPAWLAAWSIFFIGRPWSLRSTFGSKD